MTQNLVDPTKPMELEDKTPVELVEADDVSVRVRLLRKPTQWDWSSDWDSRLHAARGWSYRLEDGVFGGAGARKQLRLRNVVEESDVPLVRTKHHLRERLLGLLTALENSDEFHRATRFGPQLLVPVQLFARRCGGALLAFDVDGYFDSVPSKLDLTNTPPKPKQETWYHPIIKPAADRSFFVGMKRSKLSDCSRNGEWSSKVFEITWEGDEPISVRLV